MPPQTPPNVSEPVSPAVVNCQRRPWRWLGWLIPLVVMVTFGLIPIMVTSAKKGPRSEAISNAKQIGMAMYSFREDYGKYPDASTIEAVRQKTGTSLPLGTRFSNDYLRQLLAAGIIDEEKGFYAQIKGTHKPDRNTEGNHALGKGECGFSYIIGANSSAAPPQPLLVTPLIPGTDRFDPKPFEGKAVIYWTDDSATANVINRDGHVLDASGRNLLDPANPLWHGKPPVITWPE